MHCWRAFEQTWHKKGIAVHKIPSAGDERPQAKKRREQWIDFVKAKRAKWEPTFVHLIGTIQATGFFLRMFAVAPGQTRDTCQDLWPMILGSQQFHRFMQLLG